MGWHITMRFSRNGGMRLGERGVTDDGEGRRGIWREVLILHVDG